MLVKTLFLFLLLSSYSLSGFTQNFKTQPGYRFSKEDMHEILLEKSKSQKTKAIIAVISGPVLTGFGAYIASKSRPSLSFTGGGYVTIRKSTGEIAGACIGAFGVITTLTSIPLFISSARAKREAALVLREETTSFLNKKISVPGISLRISL